MTDKKCMSEFHGTVTVGSKGQVVIPKDVREKTGIKPGDKLITITKGNIAIGFVKSDDLAKLREYIKQEMEEKK